MRPALALLIGALSLAAPASSQQAAADPFDKPELQKDACSYLKDLFPGRWQPVCDPFNRENLRSAALDPRAIQTRAYQVDKLYRELLGNSYNAKVKNDSDLSRSGSAHTDLVLNRPEEPINERTFAAWYPNDPQLPQAFRLWVVSVNSDIRMQNPYEDQRTRDAVLANNKVNLKKMEDVKDPATFRCRLLGECASGTVQDPILVLTPQSRPGQDFQVGADNRPVRLVAAAPGGSLDGRRIPAPTPSAGSSAPVSGGGTGWGAAALMVVGGLIAGGAAMWNKRQENKAWTDAQKEVTAQDSELRARPAEPAAAKAADPDDPEALVDRGDYQIKRKIKLTPYQEKIVADIVAKADKSDPASIQRYIASGIGLGRYGKLDLEQIEEAGAVGSLVARGDIVFRAR